MPQRVLVISADELSGHMPGRVEVADYNAAPILLQQFFAEITARFSEAKQAISLSTRDNETWLRSAYWEQIKSSSMTLDYRDFSYRYNSGSSFELVISQVRVAVKAEVHSTPLEACSDLPLGPADPL